MGGSEGGNLEVLWSAAGVIAHKLAYRERPGTGGSRCGGCVSSVEAMLGPPYCQEGFLTQLSTCKLQQEVPQVFLHYLLMLLLSFPAWYTVFLSVLPCSCTAVFQIRSCRSDCLAKLFSLLLHSVAPSHVPCVYLGCSSRSPQQLLWEKAL